MLAGASCWVLYVDVLVLEMGGERVKLSDFLLTTYVFHKFSFSKKEIGQHKCRIKFYAGYVTSILFLVGMGVALWQKVYSGVLPWEVDTHFEFYLNSCLECWSVIVFCSHMNY